MHKPIVIDLFCGLGGWSEGFLAEGYDCIGFDIEAHDYGTGGYPGTLILRDVRSIHGSEFKDAAAIVASPPCQAYSYRAMPWKRAKALPPPDNTLFNECFRIQREASEAAGHYIPLIVENVRGAQKWVGRARWNYGSFYLWGDVPALMPVTLRTKIVGYSNPRRNGGKGAHLTSQAENDGRKVSMNFHEHEKTGKPGRSFQSAAVEEMGTKLGPSPGKRWEDRPASVSAHREKTMCAASEFSDAVKEGGDWWNKECRKTGMARFGSKSNARKMASAMIAKIPFPLALHIARTFKPRIEAISA